MNPLTTPVEHRFETPEPVELYVENGKGSVEVLATDTTESTVTVDGDGADETRVDLSGRRLNVIAPRQSGGLFSGGRRLDITVTVPLDSELATKLGSADLTARGRLGKTHARGGSGDVTLEEVGDSLVESGSGDVEIGRSRALRVKSGSGDVRVDHVDGDVSVSTGSGDIRLGETAGSVSTKTGSGDLVVHDAATDVGYTTGSGDAVVERLRRGRLTVKGASGDVRVGIPAGVPVWTDLTTVTGVIHSTLEGAGQPEPGADHVELRIKTVSGDIALQQI
jgi:DUF4097 and DUF4098 domain-containing protein YvlB